MGSLTLYRTYELGWARDLRYGRVNLGEEGWVIPSNVRKELAFLREEQESVFDTEMQVVGKGLSVVRPLR